VKIDVEPAKFTFACPHCGVPICKNDPVVWSKVDAEQRVWPRCWDCWRVEWSEVHPGAGDG
jgi:hypothetical protein